MKSKTLKAWVAICAAAAVGPVLADSYGSASLGKVSVVLIDLDSDDGIAASISFLPSTVKYADGALISGVAQTGQFGGTEPGNHYESFIKTAAWPGTNVSGNFSSELASASAAVSGAASGAGFTAASLSGAAFSTQSQSAYFFAEASIPGSPYDKRAFVLSAHTQVVFSVDATLAASTTLGLGRDGASESALAEATLYAGGWAQDGVTWVADERIQSASVSYLAGMAQGGGAEAWSGTMSVSYSNLAAASAEGEIQAYARVRGTSVVAVPEPEGYAMLLGGLAMLAGLARRRIRSALTF
ncbi:PEP-CTERM sorting domain-containing protein [Oxalobacteraceae bacterium A2-2]